MEAAGLEKGDKKSTGNYTPTEWCLDVVVITGA